MTSRWYVRNLQTSEEIQLLENCTVAGRSLYARISTLSNVTSKEHAKFYVRGPHLYVEDLKSSNGTYINNRKVKPHELTELQVGDRVGLGLCENDLMLKPNITTFCILEIHLVSTPDYIIDNIFTSKPIYEIFDSPIIKEEKINILDIELSENAHCPVQQQHFNTLYGNASVFKENDITNACIPSINNQTKLNDNGLENFSAKIIPDCSNDSLNNFQQKLSQMEERLFGISNVRTSTPKALSNGVIREPLGTSITLKDKGLIPYHNGIISSRNVTETVTLTSTINGVRNEITHSETLVKPTNINTSINGMTNGEKTMSFLPHQNGIRSFRNVTETVTSENLQNDLQKETCPKISVSPVEKINFNAKMNGANNDITVNNLNGSNDISELITILENDEIKTEVKETHVPTGCGYTIEDDFIIIDDDDDNNENNCSQHFNTCLNNNDEPNVINETMFYSIKKELEEMDKVEGELLPILINDDDSDTMSNSDVLNYLQSQFTDTGRSLPELEKPSTSAGFHNNINKTTVTSAVQKTIHKEKQNVGKCTTVNEKKEKETISKGAKTSTNCNGVKKGKRKYLPPPIIDAPAMPNKRRFSKESTTVKHADKVSSKESTSARNLKRSIELSSSVQNECLPKKKIKLVREQPEDSNDSRTQKSFTHKESINSLIQKKSMESTAQNMCSTKQKTKLNKEECENINKLRKQKLKEIALKNKKDNNRILPSSSVKVKKSEARGNFLLENVPDLSSFNRSPLSNNQVNIDNIILIILKWSASWLKEQEKKSNAPPLVDYDLTKMKLSFSSFKEYQKTVTGLLLLETWHYIFKESLASFVKFQANVIYEEKLSNLVKLKCITYASESTVQKLQYVKESDLVLVQLCTELNGKKCVHTVFGYINESRRSKVYKDELQMNELYSVNNKYKIEFVVLTKMFKESMEGQVLQFKIITSLISSLRLFKSINHLEYSPLCKFVIKPNINDFKIPKVSISDLMSKDLLNPTQLRVVMEATHVCLRKEPGMYLIQGPPGTGKTTVITNIVQQLLLGHSSRNVRILLAAPSNAAIDELALRLLKRVRPKITIEQRKKLKLLRVGAKSAVHEDVQDYFLDELVKKNMRQNLCMNNRETAQLIRSIEKRIEELKKSRQLSGQDNTQDIDAEIIKEKANLETILQSGYSQYNVSYKETENCLLTHSSVICTTLSSCMGKVLHDMFERAQISFTCCIIDEVTQSSEPETLIPLMLGISNMVLVGDPQQLPATVFSKDAKDLGFEKSLFARIRDNFKLQNSNPIVMLNYQYRMHPDICHFANKEYYKGKLNSSAFVAPACFGNLKPYLVFNINANYTNQLYQNDIEIEFVLKILSAITKHLSNINNTYSIGIVTPYNNQKDAILRRLKTLSTGKNASIVVNTVDSFQGQEKDVMIMSCVRYTPNTFLSNEQRVNVAITRAKYAFYVVGTQNLFDNCSVLGKLREDARKRNLLREVKSLHNVDISEMITQKK